MLRVMYLLLSLILICTFSIFVYRVIKDLYFYLINYNLWNICERKVNKHIFRPNRQQKNYEINIRYKYSYMTSERF